MSTTDTELHDCAVCENKTQLRCDACREVYFCSRECQRMIWSTHKWTCGKLTLPFSFPPLTPLEIADLEQLKDAQYTQDSNDTLLQALNKDGIFSGSWEEFLDIVSSAFAVLPSNLRPLLLTIAHHFLHNHHHKASSPASSWRMCAVTVTNALADCGSWNRTLEQIAPFLHQYLISRTIIQRLDRKPPEELGPYQIKTLLLSMNRASDVLRTLRVDDGPGRALRTRWAGATNAVAEALEEVRRSTRQSSEEGAQDTER